MPREPRWARDGPSRRAPGAMMERGHPPQAGRMQGARPFGYFWRGRPSGQLPKVTRRKGGTVSASTTATVSDQNPRIGRINRFRLRLSTGLLRAIRLMSGLEDCAGMTQATKPMALIATTAFTYTPLLGIAVRAHPMDHLLIAGMH